jgi:hypothetical protein
MGLVEDVVVVGEVVNAEDVVVLFIKLFQPLQPF